MTIKENNGSYEFQREWKGRWLMKPLNVGDRVRIAGNPPNCPEADLHGKIGTVEMINLAPDTEGLDALVRFKSYGFSYWCARRQLTKIVKPKERRRFWVNLYPPGDKVYPLGSEARLHHSRESADKYTMGDRIECIEVVEIKRGKNV